MTVHLDFNFQPLLFMVEDDLSLIVPLLQEVGEINLGPKSNSILQITVILLSEIETLL